MSAMKKANGLGESNWWLQTTQGGALSQDKDEKRPVCDSHLEPQGKPWPQDQGEGPVHSWAVVMSKPSISGRLCPTQQRAILAMSGAGQLALSSQAASGNSSF
jgi:hypothetical protein